MGRNDSLKFIRRFFTAVLVVLSAAAAVVVLFDPFYHYHAPLPGLKPVLTDKEYQCVGSLRNFEYDTVITGSSVMENTRLSVVNGAFGAHSIKAIRSFGRIADLCFLTTTALDSGNEVKLIIWNIDPGMLSAPAELSFDEAGCPMYLYDRNPFNDYPYLFNKDVLLEKIPYMLAQSFSSSYDEDNPYSWAASKSFSREDALSNYARSPEIKADEPYDAHAAELSGNIRLIRDIVEAHPETEFIFTYPPYSILYWDSIQRDGKLYSTLYDAREAARTLLSHDNVRFCSFLDDSTTAEDLTLYMDSIHFCPAINDLMIDRIHSGQGELSLSSLDPYFDSLASYTCTEIPDLIKTYEAQDSFFYGD